MVHSMKGRTGRCHGQADGVGVEVQVYTIGRLSSNRATILEYLCGVSASDGVVAGVFSFIIYMC